MSIDLHMHSTASDGAMSPSELVDFVHAQGVSIMALTDHDTVHGVKEAQTRAKALGIRLITGVEITALWSEMDVHIVGLGVDIEHSEFLAFLDGQGERRDRRAKTMGERLHALGCENAYEKAYALAGTAFISRSHFATVLLDEGLVESRNQAFKKYLGNHGPAYVKADWPSLQATVDWIHRAGGVAIIAHPGRYSYTSDAHKEALVSEFKALGGDGIEVTSGSQSPSHTEYYRSRALAYDLYASTGSDFHRLEGMRPTPGAQEPLPLGLKSILEIL